MTKIAGISYYCINVLIDQQGEITENPSEAEPDEATEPSLIEKLLNFVRRIVKLIIDLL
ncbi:MAG: hypothetical protein UHL70_08660 [Acutalibacteraceae bacterium]|nr:hypothetical protein [Acutalibacteraceae bacterium]